MTYRVAWLSPLAPASGVGTFSHAVTEAFPYTIDGERIDLTVLHPDHETVYRSRHRTIPIADACDFHRVLDLFDLVIYNIGNNREHHHAIIELLRGRPGIAICHDHVYQHYLADLSLRTGGGFAPFAAMVTRCYGAEAQDRIGKSRITSRTGGIRYCPWDSEGSDRHPLLQPLGDLASALVVHSAYTEEAVRPAFEGPILRLAMPWDQKPERQRDVHDGRLGDAAATCPFRLVSFGHIQSTKCLELVLAALADSRVLRERIRYTLAGRVADEAYLRKLKTLVATLALEETVFFATDLTEARLTQLAAEADIFINLRKPNTEGSSASLIEQLGTGKPVLVLARGCFAEIPTDAAVVLPAEAEAHDVANALETLIAQPERMLRVGAAGRRYARRTSSRQYAEQLLRFALHNRELLERRAKLPASSDGEPVEPSPFDRVWLANLGRARLSLHYLHRGIVLDPAMVRGMSVQELARYVGEVVLGLFGNPALERALQACFAGLTGAAAYWACLRFDLIAAAALAEDAVARERLTAASPCYDPAVWSVLEHLPARAFMVSAALLLAQRLPTAGELSCGAQDDADAFPKRLRARALFAASGAADEALRRWLDEPAAPGLGLDLPVLAEPGEWAVSTPDFRERVDLSGFYDMEPDHVWARGGLGFIGLRLEGCVRRVELLVRHVHASDATPCDVSVATTGVESRAHVHAPDPFWIGLDLPPHLSRALAVIWLRLTTTRAGRPPASADTRELGLALIRLRLVADAASHRATAGGARAPVEAAA